MIVYLLIVCGAMGAVPNDAVSGATPMYEGDDFSVPSISFRRVKRLQKRVPDLIFIDARYDAHFNGFQVPGAVLLNTKVSAESVREALPDQNQVMVVYCSNPECPAGFWMAQRLVEMGYRNVYEFSGGIDEWMERGEATDPGPEGSGQQCADLNCLLSGGDVTDPKSGP